MRKGLCRLLGIHTWEHDTPWGAWDTWETERWNTLLKICEYCHAAKVCSQHNRAAKGGAE